MEMTSAVDLGAALAMLVLLIVCLAMLANMLMIWLEPESQVDVDPTAPYKLEPPLMTKLLGRTIDPKAFEPYKKSVETEWPVPWPLVMSRQHDPTVWTNMLGAEVASMTDPSGEIAFACEIGLPPSTSASPSVPNQLVQAAITWSCSSFDSGMLPPWNVSRKFAMSIVLRVPRRDCAVASM